MINKSLIAIFVSVVGLLFIGNISLIIEHGLLKAFLINTTAMIGIGGSISLVLGINPFTRLGSCTR